MPRESSCPGDQMMSDTGAVHYPRVVRRIEAVIIDWLVFVVAFFTVINLVAPLEVHGGVKAAAVVLVILVLEPGLVSMTGATIGHHLRGLRVLDARSGGNLNVIRATVRFIVKSLLGFVSLIFVLVTKRHQAIHDLASGSVVIIKNPADFHTHERLLERVVEEEGYIYPSRPRRVLVILLYSVALVLIAGLLSALAFSEQCLFYDVCNASDRLYETSIELGWLAAFTVFVVQGWRGRLWGARRLKRDRQDVMQQ